MADNVTDSLGNVWATDKIGGVDYARSKATWGVDGVALDVSAANPMPVSLVEDTSTYVDGCISTPMTGTASTLLLAAPGAGLRNYITNVTICQDSTTVPTVILLQDGSGGTTRYVFPAPVGTGTGTGTSGGTFTFPVGIRQPTTNTGFYVQNVTTGSATRVSANGYKGA